MSDSNAFDAVVQMNRRGNPPVRLDNIGELRLTQHGDVKLFPCGVQAIPLDRPKGEKARSPDTKILFTSDGTELLLLHENVLPTFTYFLT
jgi:hypothetical protein